MREVVLKRVKLGGVLSISRTSRIYFFTDAALKEQGDDVRYTVMTFPGRTEGTSYRKEATAIRKATLPKRFVDLLQMTMFPESFMP